ncbi:MAG: gamma-glutamylcyclotransferase [Hyphomicrobiales bacterium]
MGDLWVFGYGSLMWRPGFAFEASVPALLYGAHRSLCVFSHVHRGTPERPGLVLGLDKGGSCRGVAFRVAAALAEETITYLRAREQITMVYLEAMRPVRLMDGSDARVLALTYLVDAGHKQYSGVLSLEEQVDRVRHGVGQSGPNREYVLNTVEHLAAMGIRDGNLARIAAHLSSD